MAASGILPARASLSRGCGHSSVAGDRGLAQTLCHGSSMIFASTRPLDASSAMRSQLPWRDASLRCCLRYSAAAVVPCPGRQSSGMSGAVHRGPHHTRWMPSSATCVASSNPTNGVLATSSRCDPPGTSSRPDIGRRIGRSACGGNWYRSMSVRVGRHDPAVRVECDGRHRVRRIKGHVLRTGAVPCDTNDDT